MINGRYYVIPQSIGLPEIGAVVGWGNTLKAAMQMAEDVAKQVEGYYVKMPIESFEEAQGEIAKLEAFNIKMF
jgi:predicted RNase H-like HicB family nuclease